MSAPGPLTLSRPQVRPSPRASKLCRIIQYQYPASPQKCHSYSCAAAMMRFRASTGLNWTVQQAQAEAHRVDAALDTMISEVYYAGSNLPEATYLAARSIPLSPCSLIGLLRRAFCSKLLTTSKWRGQRRRKQGCDQAVGSGSSSRRGVRLAHPFKTRGAISPGMRLANGCDWRRQRC